MVIFFYVIIFYLTLEIISYFFYEKVISVSEIIFKTKIITKVNYSQFYVESIDNPIELSFYEISFFDGDKKINLDVSFEIYDKLLDKNEVFIKKISKCVERKKMFCFNPKKSFYKSRFDTYVVK